MTARLATRSGAVEYDISGTGSPRIVLCAGAGVTMDAWQPLRPAIESLGTVFAWNRFGQAGSAIPAAPQTGMVVVAALREVLRHAGLAPPYVLVGHSLGGLHVNLFARVHPQDVAAVMLIEATHPRDPQLAKASDERQALRLLRSLARQQDLPPDVIQDNLRAELGAAAVTARAIEAAGNFPDVPLTVITGGFDPPASVMSQAEADVRHTNQRRLARLGPQGRHVVAQRSGHFPQWSEPRLVITELAQLVARTRVAA